MIARCRHILFNVLATLSTLVFLATAALWVRSYWVADVVGNVSGSGAWCARVSSYRGVFRAYTFHGPDRPTKETSHFEYTGVALPTNNDLFGALALSIVL